MEVADGKEGGRVDRCREVCDDEYGECFESSGGVEEGGCGMVGSGEEGGVQVSEGWGG